MSARACVIAASLGAFGAPSAVAQQRIPGTADPFRLQQQFRPVPAPHEVPPPTRIEESPPRPVPAGADDVRLALTEINLEGATAYDASALAPLWQALLGREVSLAELYEVAAAITIKYRNDGYILSRAIVPAQAIDDGVVRIEVIEGYIGKVTIDGEVGRPSLLHGYADKIIGLRPLRVAALERYLLLLDGLAGATVQSVLSPLQGEPGAALLSIEIAQKMVDAFATMDNRGTRYLGPFQTSVGGRLNSVLGLYEQTQIRLIGTPAYADELRAYDLTHSVPVDTEGTVLTLGLNQAFAHPGFTLKPLRISSAVVGTSATLIHPLVRQRAENLQASVGLIATDLRTDLFAGTLALLNDRIRALQVAGLYDFVDSHDGINLFGLSLSHGLDVLGARTSGSPNLSRASGRSDFTKLVGDAQRVQSLGGDWSLLLAVTGQYGFTSLLASEQINLGGVHYLRAYDTSELAGDSGIAGKLELQYGERRAGTWFTNYQLYGYYDIGRVWNRQPAAGEHPAASATALGAGLRFTVTEGISGVLELAKPLTRPIATEGDKDPRVFFGLVARF
jgi:hemolysin activation/secretion protein